MNTRLPSITYNPKNNLLIKVCPKMIKVYLSYKVYVRSIKLIQHTEKRIINKISRKHLLHRVRL